jgi:hypothetical protein
MAEELLMPGLAPVIPELPVFPVMPGVVVGVAPGMEVEVEVLMVRGGAVPGLVALGALAWARANDAANRTLAASAVAPMKAFMTFSIHGSRSTAPKAATWRMRFGCLSRDENDVCK